MNEWAYQMRRRKREDRCLINGRLCGCGYHRPPSKKAKRRIVKRIMARKLHKEMAGWRLNAQLQVFPKN